MISLVLELFPDSGHIQFESVLRLRDVCAIRPRRFVHPL
jgi:hypothetical protein